MSARLAADWNVPTLAVVGAFLVAAGAAHLALWWASERMA